MSVQSEINRLKQSVSDAFTAIGNKGGTVPSSKVSGNLATAIQSIPEGVTVQRAEGTFKINTSGQATVSGLSFTPDIVLITGLYYTFASNNEFHAAVIFPETTQNEYIQIAAAYSDKYSYGINFQISRNNNGFTVIAVKFSSSWNQSYVTNASFNYVAIKYT